MPTGVTTERGPEEGHRTWLHEYLEENWLEFWIVGETAQTHKRDQWSIPGRLCHCPGRRIMLIHFSDGTAGDLFFRR